MKPKPKCDKHCFANIIFPGYCDCLIDISEEYREQCKFYKNRDEFKREALIEYDIRRSKPARALR